MSVARIDNRMKTPINAVMQMDKRSGVGTVNTLPRLADAVTPVSHVVYRYCLNVVWVVALIRTLSIMYNFVE